MKNLYESILSYTCSWKVVIKQLYRKVMTQFGDTAMKDIKRNKTFMKKYFPHVENLVLIDIK